MSRRLPVAAEAAWRAVLRLVEEPDPARGVTGRRCTPSPPRRGSRIVSRGADGRERVAEILELAPRERLVLETREVTPVVRQALALEPDGAATVLRLEVTTTAGIAPGRRGALLDRLLYGRAQRRAAHATLARLAELAAAAR